MIIVKQPLTNKAYGYPTDGAERRVNPIALACLHITDNESTASDTNLHRAAQSEWTHANRANSSGPSAHYYVARDGWAIEAIDPIKYAAWSNGRTNNPNLNNPGIARVIALVNSGYNPNEAYVLEIENIGFSGSHPVTDDQRQFCGEVIALHSKRTGIPVNRETVHGHWELDSVNKPGCPCPVRQREMFLNDVILRANQLIPCYSEQELADEIWKATQPLQGQIAVLSTTLQETRDSLTRTTTELNDTKQVLADTNLELDETTRELEDITEAVETFKNAHTRLLEDF